MRAADVYRALLWCYPACFRHEYGSEMQSAFGEQLAEARRAAGTRGAASVWATTLADFIPTAFQEHRHVLHQDLRHAVRSLAAAPALATAAILSLALGIGANTAIFSLLNNVIMSRLPVRDADTLVLLTDPGSRGVAIGAEGGERSLATYQEFRELQQRTTTIASLMASGSGLQRTEARVDGGEPEEIAVRMVSASYFATLDVDMRIGATFDPAREPAPGTAPFAIVSHEFWQRRFGGRADVLGRSIAARGGTLSIVGVAPAGFFGETVGERPDLWVPLAMQAAILPGRDWLNDQPGSVDKVMWLHLFGRLRPGVARERAEADVNLILKQELIAHYGFVADAEKRKRFLDQHFTIRSGASGASSVRDSFSEPLLVLLAAAGLVLVIACANLGNLLLARTTGRHRELTVRLALGASRGRLIRQLLTETLCLAAAGGVLGLGVAMLLREGLLQLVSTAAIALPPAFDLRTLAFSFALTLVAGLALGLLSAMRITRTQAVAGLREEGRGVVGSRAWLRVGRLIVVGQIALSLPLLVGAGLLVRTLFNLQRIDLGFPREDLITVRVDVQAAGYDPARQVSTLDQLLARIRAIPGVRAATYSNLGLFGGSYARDQVAVEGYTATGRGDLGSDYDHVAADYFPVLGVPVLLGRGITEQDRAGGRMVCVINEAFARRFFDGRTPIGLHVTQVYGDESHTYEVVGVVRDFRQSQLRRDIEHRYYVPASQPASALDAFTFVVRPSADPSNVLGAVRRVLRESEPRMPVIRATTLAAAVAGRMVEDALLAKLSIGFGLAAMLLAATGLYGVLAYGVSRRTNEMGIRKALGAPHAALVGMIARETGGLVVLGLIVGSAVSVAVIRLISSRLYGLTPSDPVTIAAAVFSLGLVAALATCLPAYRASRVDPLTALRHD